MKPTFRSDLTCSREEQQGVVFYRIDDPKAQTSFRLYEIEYLIAKKLDGSRPISDVIIAVKKEFNFDISEPDLQRFVNQLESMGFLMPREGGPEPSEPEPETQVMERPQRPTAEPPTESKPQPLDLLDDDQLSKPGGLDQSELDRLLRSAFLHVKQGYIVHARDYFLAAKELNPTDERLTKLVHHLEIIGDSSGPAEVEYLWNQAKELFPEVAEEVGPLIDAKSGVPEDLAEPTERIATSGDEDIKSRVIWALVALVVLAGGVGGLVFVFSNYGHRIFGTAARVRVVTLKVDRIPVYFDGGAAVVSPLEKRWMSPGADGTVDKVNVSVGDRVEKGDILATLELADRMSKQLAKARKGVKRADGAVEKAKKRLDKINAERDEIETERIAADERLKELSTPDSVLKKGGSTRDIKKWRQIKVDANKKLSRLAKKERGPRKQLKKAEKKHAAAVKKLDSVYDKIGDKVVRAEFAGVIGELKVKPGQTVSTKDELVLLTDPSGVQLTFEVSAKAGLQAGGEVHVSVSRGAPNVARVIRVTEEGDGATVAIKLPDPSGGFQEIEPTKFRLVQEFAEPAFSVPASAIVEGDESSFVLMVQQKRAMARNVVVLQRDALNAVIRDKSGSLRDGIDVVAVHVGEVPLSDIPDGSFLEIEK